MQLPRKINGNSQVVEPDFCLKWVFATGTWGWKRPPHWMCHARDKMSVFRRGHFLRAWLHFLWVFVLKPVLLIITTLPGSSQASSDLLCPTGGGALIHKMEFGLHVARMESIISFENDDSAFQLTLEMNYLGLQKTERISYQICSKAVKGRLGNASQFPLFL